VQSTQLEHSSADIALQIMDLAGGAGYGRGRPFIGGIGGRASSHIGRFGYISHACAQDAAASAAAAMWGEWRRSKGAAKDTRMERCGARAAFRSITGDITHGGTGRLAGNGTMEADPETVRLSMERASFARWSSRKDNGADRYVLHERAHEVIGWISSVLEPAETGRKGRADLKRLTFLVQLIRGMDFTEAAQDAGYASARSALEALRYGKVWERLRNAMARHPLRPGAALEVKGLQCGWLSGNSP